MAAEPKSDSAASLRITVERNPSESRLSELGIKSWPKWGCSPGKYQLKFEERETCYLVKGKVRAYPREGASAAAVAVAASSSSDGGYVEFGAGDLVIIPKGLSCTWDVSLPVDKYYKFDASSPSSSPPPPFC